MVGRIPLRTLVAIVGQALPGVLCLCGCGDGGKSAEPAVALIAPNGGESWPAGSTQHIRWRTENIEDVTISYSSDGGQTWKKIVDSVDRRHADWGKYPWKVPAEPSAGCRILISGYFGQAPTHSAEFFTITAALAAGPDHTSSRAAPSAAPPPRASERAALERIGGLAGVIVWHSNRDGHFRIYRMNADGTDKRRLTRARRAKDHHPRWSPDGKQIAFTREQRRRSQVFVMEPDGSNPRRVIDDGELCSWTPDGGRIVWQTRRMRRVLVRDLKTGRDREILPGPVALLRGHQMGQASFSPDGQLIAFCGNWQGYQAVGVVGVDGQNLRTAGPGCEPFWHPGGSHVYFVRRQDNPMIYRNNRACDRPQLVTSRLARGRGRRDHEYFPAVSNDGAYLVWGICPWDQHDHWRSDYEIFIQKLPDGNPVRLTFHPGTDAWPHLHRP